MNNKFLVPLSVFGIIGIGFGAFALQTDAKTTGLNEPAYQSLETSIENRMPGLSDGRFREHVESYCNSERSASFAQTIFTIEDKTLSYREAETVKNILDSSDVCA